MTGVRAHYLDTILDAEGRPLPGVSVYVYDEYTTTPIGATIYEYDSSHPTLSANTLTNPLTSGSNGKVEFWLASANRVTLHPVKVGYSFDDRVVDAIDTTGAGVETLPASIVDAKGDLLVGTAADTPARKAVGADDTILMADSAQADGTKWQAPAGTGEIANVATAEAAGTSDTWARGDHVHALDNDVATYAKVQNVSAASKLLGRGSAAGSGDVEEIALGTGLSMSGTTLSATAAADGWTTVTKTVDESVSSSTVLQDDDELFFTATSNIVYRFEGLLIYASPVGGATPNIQIGIGEDTTTSRGTSRIVNQDISSGQWTVSTVFTALSSAALNGKTQTTKRAMVIEWGVHVGNGGTFKLKWCQQTSNANATILYAGSYIKYKAVTS